MAMQNRIGNWILSLTMSVLFFRWVHDSQSGMWVFERQVLSKMCALRDNVNGMAFSEEIKIEAIRCEGDWISPARFPSTIHSGSARKNCNRGAMAFAISCFFLRNDYNNFTSKFSGNLTKVRLAFQHCSVENGAACICRRQLSRLPHLVPFSLKSTIIPVFRPFLAPDSHLQ